MVCLDKDKLINKRSKRKKDIKIEEKISEKELLLKQFNLFVDKVIKKISEDKLPVTPEIYQIYFEQMIHSQPFKIKEKIQRVLSLKKEQTNNKITPKTEKDFNDSFTIVKSMLNSISDTYRKIHQMQVLTKTKQEEISKNPNKYALISFEDNLTTLSNNLNANLKILKTKYEQILMISKTFNQNSVYDNRFDTYNKKYLLQQIDEEIENIKNFEHHSVILAIKIDEKSFVGLNLSKDKTLIMKNVAKLIIKSSNKSDVVAYFENGIFIILLKYTTQEQAIHKSTKIKDLASSVSFVIDSSDIDVALLSGVSLIKPDLSKEEIISQAIDNLGDL